MVRRIFVYTREEINRMGPRTLNPEVEENSPAGSLEDKPLKHLPAVSP